MSTSEGHTHSTLPLLVYHSTLQDIKSSNPPGSWGDKILAHHHARHTPHGLYTGSFVSSSLCRLEMILYTCNSRCSYRYLDTLSLDTIAV